MSLPASLATQECQISDLSDTDLLAIFQNLLPFERLLVSEVCRRWLGISRKAWLDVTSLDLSRIPGRTISVIVSYCPNLQSVSAQQKSFGLRELYSLPKTTNLSCVKFYDCDFATEKIADANENTDFAWIFSDHLKHTSWSELIIHNSDPDYCDAGVSEGRWPKWSFSAANLPASLTRLQLSGLIADRPWGRPTYVNLLKSLELLPNLEYLILLASSMSDKIREESENVLKRITSLKHLKELALCPGFNLDDIAEFVSSLPKLEVLFLYDIADCNVESLGELITDAPVLRILLLSAVSAPESCNCGFVPNRVRFETGDVDLPLVLPARKRFPRGFGSDPLPQLHIFIDGSVSPHVRFTKSVSDAAFIHAINLPLPEFLERDDIAPIFEGVWVAEKIKETAKQDPTVWLNNVGDTLNCIQYI